MVSDRGSAPELRAGRARGGLVPLRCSPRVRVRADAGAGRRARRSARRELARAAGAQVSLDLSSWTLIDDAFRARARALAPELVFAVEREREALGELDARWVVKRGAGRRRRRRRGLPGRADRGRRHDRRRRRVRGRLPRRRRRGRARGRGALLREARGDAVIRVAEEVARRRSHEGPRRGRARDDARRARLPAGRGRRGRRSPSERAVREAGSVPATIGILDGEIVVGLSRARAPALRLLGAQGRPARRRRRGGAGRGRRDDGRRDARRLHAGRHPLHGAPAASAASTAAGRRRPTSRPTCTRSRERRRSSSRRA